MEDDAVVAYDDTVGITLPANCTDAEGDTLRKLDVLLRNGIIGMPNVTNCLPHCGLCVFAVTDKDYSHFNLVVIGALLPLIGCLGLVGNCLSAFVYSRKEMRSSTNTYLCCLGCSDCTVIGTAIMLFSLETIKRFSYGLSVAFGALSPIIYPAAMAAQTCSVYFTLIAGFDCFVQSCLPESVRRRTSRPTTVRRTAFLVAVFSILYNIPRYFEAVVVGCWHEGFQARSLEVCPDPMRFNELYTDIYVRYMYSTFLAVGPLVVLIILNACIIYATVFSKAAGSSGGGDTMSLILVVLLFIFCNMAALIINLLETKLGDWLGHKINYVVDMSNLMVVLNSSMNFLIYYFFSDDFRATFHCYVVCNGSSSVSRSSTRENGIGNGGDKNANTMLLIQQTPTLAAPPLSSSAVVVRNAAVETRLLPDGPDSSAVFQNSSATTSGGGGGGGGSGGGTTRNGYCASGSGTSAGGPPSSKNAWLPPLGNTEALI